MLEARKQYPRDMHICVNLAEIMELYEGGTAQQTATYREGNFSNQIYTLCKRVLDDSRNEQDRNRAMKMLCNHYVKAGNTTEAINIANSMADMFHSREVLLGEILTGDDKLKQLQENIFTAAEYIASMLVKIPFQKEYGFTARFTPDEKIEYVTSANGIYKLLISDENYLIHHRDICWNDRRLAELFLLKGDRDKAFEYLLDAEKHARLFDCMNKLEPGKYTSLVLNCVECRPEDYPKAWEGSETEMLAYRLDEMKSYFDGHAGFDELKKRIGKADGISL